MKKTNQVIQRLKKDARDARNGFYRAKKVEIIREGNGHTIIYLPEPH